MEPKNLGLDEELVTNILNAFSNNHFARRTGIVLTSLGPGTLTAQLTVTKDVCNMLGTMHGGATAALADTTMGMCCCTLNSWGITADFNVYYFLPVSENETITSTGKIIRSGKKAIFVECALANGKGQLVAKASGTFFNGGPLNSNL